MPLFTRQHYEAIATVIGNADRYDCGDISGPGLVEDIMNMLAADNPLFNRQLFEAAIGPYADRAGE